ncbi:hypothetical protein ACFSCW_04895 [Sphingomonas tabacisoli]|uniref:Uncharacterized protein n=1 Tax=Sphingomonas tabacisoli TaxID=2249466 RepID=A0ABW4I0Q2_9SPHN
MEGQTGARDETYDVVAVLYHALKGADNCRKYIQDSPNGELRQFFEQAQQMQRQLAERAKQCMHRQLMQGGEDQSQSGQGAGAFSFSQQGSSKIGQQSETGSTGMGSSQNREMSGSESNENFAPAGK